MKKHGILDDLYRYCGNKRFIYIIKYLFKDNAFRYIYVYRKAQSSKNLLSSIFFRIQLKHMKFKYGLEICKDIRIGSGLYLGHAYNININPCVVIVIMPIFIKELLWDKKIEVKGRGLLE